MKTNVRSKSTIKTKGKDGGKFEQRFKSKSVQEELDKDGKRIRVSVLKTKGKEGGRFKSKMKSVSLGNGKYRVCKVKDGGKSKCRVITKKVASRKMKRKAKTKV